MSFLQNLKSQTTYSLVAAWQRALSVFLVSSPDLYYISYVAYSNMYTYIVSDKLLPYHNYEIDICTEFSVKNIIFLEDTDAHSHLCVYIVWTPPVTNLQPHLRGRAKTMRKIAFTIC